ncbi:AbrB/MazE/SpoVT family DNA-binding domain-containing protein [Caulobacter mirabilis]|uniref:AbrB family transcriptional regulator n=1 Tax=Caulobacter mirabilis TaxID=69666 RepID=A0A2D2AW53_9CAUL|nr:AbrB/MazE/SpoVT family DNA-binding domain-containing protein [Caulobacter mirabilis]ATQ42226.1 AbrB family transcriptional regulator [Caulobacter mirabilis]
MNAIRGRVTESGRLSLPAEFRRAVGLEQGGDVVIELDGQTIRVRSIAEVVADTQALAKQLFAGRGVSTDDFLADRRAEAGDE